MSLETLTKILQNASGIKEFIVGLQSEPLQDGKLFDKLALIKSTCPDAKLTIETLGLDLTIPIAVSLRDAGVDKVKINVYSEPKPTRVRHFHYLGIEVELIVVVNSSKRFNSDYLRTVYGGQCTVTEVPLDNGRGFVYDFDQFNNRELDENGSCTRPFQELCINVDGQVIGCQNDYTSIERLGDATAEPLLTLWNDAAFKRFRQFQTEQQFEDTICENCTFRR